MLLLPTRIEFIKEKFSIRNVADRCTKVPWNSIEDNGWWATSFLIPEDKNSEFKFCSILSFDGFNTLASSSLDFLTFFAPFFFPPDLQAKQIKFQWDRKHLLWLPFE